jgi:MoaA/NifB/PqqE/SkfB family radical SAM enzyme
MPGELPLTLKKFLINEMAIRNVSHVVFAGGEPLLSADALEVIPWTNGLGIAVGLQTNAFFLDRLRAVLPHLDWVAFPIDGVSSKTQKMLRTSTDQLAQTKAAVKLLRSCRSVSAKLKIGTVVTPQNLDELPQIAAEVELLQPDIWKWYQVRPRGAGRSAFDSLRVSSENIEHAYSAIRSQHPNLRIFVSFVEQSVNAYLIVNPDSEALVPQVDTYVSAGYLIKGGVERAEFDDFVWNSFLAQRDKTAQLTNMVNSFPDWLERTDS